MKRLLVAGFLIATIAAPAARAKETVQLQVFPAHPRVGHTATLQLRAYGTRPRAAPTVLSKAPTVVATSTAGRGRFTIAMRRSPADAHLWTAHVRFPARGGWTLWVRGDRWSPRLDVKVRRRGQLSIWDRLQRPLTIPTISRGDACPVTTAVGDPNRIGLAGTFWGAGPVYVGLPGATPTLLFSWPPAPLFADNAWSGNKAPWVIDALYDGPVLVRGHQLDGLDPLQFDRSLAPQLRFAAGERRGHGLAHGSFTRVRTPGCYAYQVDGLGFSYAIVFEAKLSS